MSTGDVARSSRPVRWGLAVKLFAILLLLGAIAVLLTSVMGYLRARDALQEAIYNQLTTARKSKARQVETYFRTLGKEPDIKQYLPDGNAAYYLQYYYIVTNPDPPDRRKLLDDAHDGSAWSRQHAISHPLMRAAAASFGFFDINLIDARTGRLVYGVLKEADLGAALRTGFYRQTNLAAAVARCATATDRSATCFEDFAPYAPSGGAPIAFMAAPVIDQGQAIGVNAAQLSIEESDNVVTGDRKWRQDGFGATG